ncbi:unnamed protein product [Angiostrongylus costaricensis]|uniref:Uncharacterized protein n=1 Tax=Angiostrongylus costaricensis TaxID=334426 RepID=A0A0R3Q1X7_ANGCS|nr:unnamed protein product [Angiostrongylus costaricensis]
MGQRLAPSLAIAFMSKVEAPVTDLGPLLYCRCRWFWDGAWPSRGADDAVVVPVAPAERAACEAAVVEYKKRQKSNAPEFK